MNSPENAGKYLQAKEPVLTLIGMVAVGPGIAKVGSVSPPLCGRRC